ncbi:hypothetical protein D1872_314010 [compost metagenome]
MNVTQLVPYGVAELEQLRLSLRVLFRVKWFFLQVPCLLLQQLGGLPVLQRVVSVSVHDYLPEKRARPIATTMRNAIPFRTFN